VKPHLARAALAAAVLLPLPHASAAEYPERPIRIIIEFPPGGATDVVARRVGAKLTERFGQQVLVDNRSGAGGVIAHEAAARAPADGYTLLLATTTFTANASLRKKLPYDALKDFDTVAFLADWGGLLVLHPSIPSATLGEFIALAKRNPGKLSYSSAGVGTWPHLSMEMLMHRAGIRVAHIPYKGAVPALQDVIAGFVAAKVDSYVTSIPHMRTGRLKAIGVTTGKRMPQAPDVPTIAEQGFPGYDTAIWLGLVTRKGTPREVIARLEQSVIAILKERDIADRLFEDGYRIIAGTGAELDAHLRRELDQWRRITREAGIDATD